MPWWLWIPVAVFVASVAPGAVVVARALASMRRARTLGEDVVAGLDGLARKAEELERRLAHAQERSAFVEERLARLEADWERFSVLTWALGDVSRTIAHVRSAITLQK